jgi:hypothetical protein
MDLYNKLNNDDEFIDFFCDTLEDLISTKAGHGVNVVFKKYDMSIFFFIDGSSILQIIPDKELQYTYAHTASYESEVKKAMRIIETQYNRDIIISEIIKKES